MNKSELTAAMAANSNLTQAEAKEAIDCFVKIVSYKLKRGEKVSITGFGSFSIVNKKERVGVNPSTQDKIKIEAKKTVKFKAGAELADKVNAK